MGDCDDDDDNDNDDDDDDGQEVEKEKKENITANHGVTICVCVMFLLHTYSEGSRTLDPCPRNSDCKLLWRSTMRPLRWMVVPNGFFMASRT